MLTKIKKLIKNEEGQAMVEYGLILAGIAILALIAIGAMSGGLNALFAAVTAAL